MKTLLLTCLMVFFSLSLSAQTSADPKAEARHELTSYLETIKAENPELALTMKEENILLRALVAKNLHLKSIDDGVLGEAVSATERAELVQNYQDRVSAILGPDRMKIVLEAAKAATTAEEPEVAPVDEK